VRFGRAGLLPAPDQSARLKLQATTGKVVEREYRLLPVIRATGPLSAEDDPASWGEPTLVLDTGDRTMSCPKLQTPSPDWGGPEDLSARLWLRWDPQALHIGLQVRDDVQHESASSPPELWQFDSVQYGFDHSGDADPSRGDGWDGRNDSEWLAGLFRGAPTLWRHTSPETVTPAPVDGVPFTQRRVGQTTLYVASFPWRVLPPATGEPGTVLGFNFIANDNDGAGRKGWLGITAGMGECKAPGKFMKAVLLP
jgi:hypothetical protein